MSSEDSSSEKTVVETSKDAKGGGTVTSLESISVPEVEIKRVVAFGGMSALYEGVQPFLNRTVAVKVLRQADQWEASLTERFQREAQLLAELDHPHVVSCFSAGRLPDGRCYLVMEFVHGPNLADFVRSTGVLAEREALLLIRDMAAALQHAKDHGIIHRDVKPQNILLKPVSSQSERTGKFPFVSMLSDLGIARYEAGSENGSDKAELTQKGTFVGTPAYMAPEQFDDAATVDHRADIYGLGGVLYFALAGEVPFGSQSVSDLIRRKSFGQPRPIAEVAPNTSGPVREFLSSMLATDKEKRPQNYADVISICTSLAEGGKTEELPVPPKAKSGVGIVPIVAGIAGVVLLYVFVAKPNPAGGDAAKATKMTTAVLSDARLAATAATKLEAAAQVATPEPTSTPSPEPTPVPAVRVALEFAQPPTPLLVGEFLDRFKGWEVSGAFAPDEENSEGAIGNSFGSKTSSLTRPLPTAPWRFAGQIDLKNGREGGVRFESDGTGYYLRLQSLGSSMLATLESPDDVKTVLGTIESEDVVSFTASFDGVDLVLGAGEFTHTATTPAMKSIALVAIQDVVAFRHLTIEAGPAAPAE